MSATVPIEIRETLTAVNLLKRHVKAYEDVIAGASPSVAYIKSLEEQLVIWRQILKREEARE